MLPKPRRTAVHRNPPVQDTPLNTHTLPAPTCRRAASSHMSSLLGHSSQPPNTYPLIHTLNTHRPLPPPAGARPPATCPRCWGTARSPAWPACGRRPACRQPPPDCIGGGQNTGGGRGKGQGQGKAPSHQWPPVTKHLLYPPVAPACTHAAPHRAAAIHPGACRGLV